MKWHQNVTGNWTSVQQPWFLNSGKKEFRSEPWEKVSHLDCMGSGNRLKGQKKGPCSLGERKQICLKEVGAGVGARE